MPVTAKQRWDQMLSALRYAHRYNYSRFWTGKPIILTHSVTSKCNCKCLMCDVWRKPRNEGEMATRDILRTLVEARNLKFAAYLVWGGEPLLRRDIMEIMQCAHSVGLYTSLITNGIYLSQRAREMANCVDLTWVSLDYNSEYHDRMRAFPGAFERASTGIVALRRMGGRVVINCVLSKLNRDAVPKMAALAEELDTKLAFDPMHVFPGINDRYALSDEEVRNLATEILRYKKAGYPILNSYDYLRHLTKQKKYSCAQPKIFITVSETGEITPFWCTRNGEVLGDLRKQSLGDVLCSDSYAKYARSTDHCSSCSNSVNVETSMFYSVRNFLTNCFKIPNPILRFILDYAD